MVNAILFAVVFLQALVLSLLLTPLSIRLAIRTKHLDHPGHRKIHEEPHPVLGGLAIFLAFNLTILGDILLSQSALVTRDLLPSFGPLGSVWREIRFHLPGVSLVAPKLYAVMAGGLLLFLVGLWDDRHGLEPKWKLLSQFIASMILVCSNVQFDLFPGFPLVNKALTILWVIGLTNAFNLLDNMDGLTAGVAAIVAFFFAAIAYQMAQTFMVLILLAFLGSLLGFLHFNTSPAKTFMGDAGAMFIGYVLGGLSILITYYDTSSLTVLALSKPLVILAVPAFDTLSVVAIRLRHRKPLFAGDKNHFSHRLVALGMSRRRAVLFIYLVTFCTGLGALLLRLLNVMGTAVVIGQVGIIFWIIILLERVKTREE